jgi:hypothetical protein
MPAKTLRLMTGALAFACVVAPPAFADPAKGTVTQAGRSATMRYAWLVVGPDAVDPKKTIREVVLSANDIGAKLKACTRMGCASGLVDEGMTIDFDAGPRLNYWVSLSGQRVQYSGTEPPASFVATANDGKRIAGRLRIDKKSAGGPTLDVEFDAPLAKTFTAP